LEEQIQKEQQCTDVSDFSISLTISRLRLDWTDQIISQ
jgi:hypothetical protein